MVFGGFARSCEALDHLLPVIMKVEYSYKNAFTIEVGEDVALNNTLIGVIE